MNIARILAQELMGHIRNLPGEGPSYEVRLHAIRQHLQEESDDAAEQILEEASLALAYVIIEDTRAKLGEAAVDKLKAAAAKRQRPE